MKSVIVVGDEAGYYRPFRSFGSLTCDLDLLSKPKEVAFVLFTGGADVEPLLYGEQSCRYTSSNPNRDIFEVFAFRQAMKANIPMVGICRGAQFLCVMAGGQLYQHVTGHTSGHHIIRTWDNREVMVNSLHHQMACPPPDCQILAWADPPLSKCFLGANDYDLDPPDKEYECIFYPSINSLGLQYHPEMMSEKTPGFRYAEELVHECLLKKS